MRLPRSRRSRVDDLTIAPAQVGEGEPVTVEARVTNLTSEQIAPVLAVYLDSLPDSAQRVLLGPNEARTITFDVEPKEGAHEVRLDRLTGKLTVGPAIAATATPSGDVDGQPDGGGGAGVVVVAGAVAVVVIAVAVIVVYRRRRARRQA